MPPPDYQIVTILQAWRSRLQTRVMLFGSLLAFPAVVQTIWRAIQRPNEWPSALVLVTMYAGIVILAVNRHIAVRIRGWLLIFILYLIAIVALARGGLWGDGRVYLVLLPVFGILFIDVGVGKLLIALSLIGYSIFGFFNHIGLLSKWMISHEVPAPTEIWFYDGLIFGTLMITAAVALMDFHNLLMEVLTSEYETAENLRQAHHLLDQVNLELEEKVLHRTSELAQANERLHDLVNHDALTGLPNRTLFFKNLDHSILQAQHHHRELAVLFIDLDNFKNINDTFGHLQGDRLLEQVAERLCYHVRHSDTVARLSGDEFAVIVEELGSIEDASLVVEKMIEALSKPFEWDDAKIELSASIGISIFPVDGDNADLLVRRADSAMYAAKRTAKGDFQFYTPPEDVSKPTK